MELDLLKGYLTWEPMWYVYAYLIFKYRWHILYWLFLPIQRLILAMLNTQYRRTNWVERLEKLKQN